MGRLTTRNLLLKHMLFTTGFLEAGYRRFLERRLREEFGFHGSPVRVNVRVRDKREQRRKR